MKIKVLRATNIRNLGAKSPKSWERKGFPVNNSFFLIYFHSFKGFLCFSGDFPKYYIIKSCLFVYFGPWSQRFPKIAISASSVSGFTLICQYIHIFRGVKLYCQLRFLRNFFRSLISTQDCYFTNRIFQ